MKLLSLDLSDFRCYKQSTFEFSPLSTVIVGPNGSGKTNILEAIHFLSTGKSFRGSSLPQLLHWNSNFTWVRGQVVKGHDNYNVEVQLLRQSNNAIIKRRFLQGGVNQTRKQFLTLFNSVVFHPEDIRLVNGSPSRRREFIDSLLSQLDWHYATALTQYNRALKHRNELLDLIRMGKSNSSELYFWDQSLSKNGDILIKFRSEFFKYANYFLSHHQDPEVAAIFFSYYPNSVTTEKLTINFSSDIQRGHTQFGPHRDDYSFNSNLFQIDNKNMAFWGSRGQQRLTVLALKLAEVAYIHNYSKFRPVLLLDDIFSELDEHHRALVDNLCKNYQTIITTSEENIDISTNKEAKIIRLST